MMAPKATYVILTLSIILLIVTSISAIDITNFLKKYPEFKTYNDLLTKTKVADKINQQGTVTVLLLDNTAIGPIAEAPENMLRVMLETNVLLDYYDTSKLKQLDGQSENATNLFQNSGQAQGNQGLTHITTKGGATIFSSAVKGAPQDSKLVKMVDAEPYTFSAIQINKPIVTPGNEVPQSSLSSPIGSPETSPTIIGNDKAPSPSSMKGYNQAPSPSTMTGNAQVPTPSTMGENGKAPTPSAIAPTPSAMVNNDNVPTPSAMMGNDKAPTPTPSPMMWNTKAPTPSPMMWSTKAPAPSTMMGNAEVPTPSPMMGNNNAPTPSNMIMSGNGPAPTDDTSSPNANAPKPAKGNGGSSGGAGPSSDSANGAPTSGPSQGQSDEASDTEAPPKNVKNDGSAKLTTLGGAMVSSLSVLVALAHL